MELTRSRNRSRRQGALVAALCVMALAASACGSRLTGSQQALAQGAALGKGGTGAITGTGTASAAGVSTTAAGTASATTTPAASGTGTTTPAAGTGASTAAAPKTAASSAAPCGPDGNETPAGGNGGATATGVTASTIDVGNIASITGVVPGLTQSAQQATEAWAAYVNSQGGICGRQIHVDPMDDQNTTAQNYADSQQACSADFAMVGNASGFDDGEAQSVSSCDIPVMAAEVSTAAAGAVADIFGASPGNAQYYPLGAAEYLAKTYPTAVKHAAMIYLNVSATQTNAAHEVAAYTSAGFHYVYDVSTTPTNANYASNVLAMQQAGVQYVTEYSDDDSAERLLQAMQQQNFAPQVVDWFSEEYTPSFAKATAPESNGDLVLLSATDAYEEASGNPGMQLFLSWLNRVAPGANHDIFGILAWSAGLAFEQAAKAVGPDLTRPALITQLKKITSWTGGGVTPAVNIGQKIPTKCFAYFKIENGAFQRVYPSAPNTFDCSGSLYTY
jgi:ABC-type branched-subunit amino acid transport system substrate-binding protein